MEPHRRRPPAPCLAAMMVVGLTMAGLLAGREPVGGDPDLLYRPLKSELARSLAQGRLPFWSHRLGLGVPAVAESHVAAFYPPNWLAYRLLPVPLAYRLMMWLHAVALAATTYAYARTLRISPWGSAVSATAFALCGFQAVHTVHEPFYCLMPYLPLCLLLADRYATTGHLSSLAGLAIAWGVQLTLGHFQVQMWTAGLVLFVGGWKAISLGRLWRPVGLAAGLAWGAAIASCQLVLTWEMVGVAGFHRPIALLSNYAFPPGHWAQLALPGLYLLRQAAPGDTYWANFGTVHGEACLYAGVVPMILAFVGLVAAPRDRAFTPWRLLAPLGFLMATMPRWWPDGFWYVLQLPGLGWFRAPARYTLWTSLAIALLAGRGLDRAISSRRFGFGIVLAVAFAVAAFAWSASWARGEAFRLSMGAETLPWRFASAAVAWAVGLGTVLAWRRAKVPDWAPFGVVAVELVALFHAGPTRWDPAVALPDDSPTFARLLREPEVGLVGGRVENLPVRAGLTTAFPYLGIVPPPPNYMLEPAVRTPPAQADAATSRWSRRFGVTHAIWPAEDPTGSLPVLLEGPDPALDRIANDGVTRRWKLVRYPDAFPKAWVARKAIEARRWGFLHFTLSNTDAPDEAYYLTEDRPPDGPGPRAGLAKVVRYDGESAEVQHDGDCDLILRRAYYPGWLARIDDGPERPVLRVNGGLQAVRLEGQGTHRVTLRYEPTGLRNAARTSLIATAAAVVVIGLLHSWGGRDNLLSRRRSRKRLTV